MCFICCLSRKPNTVFSGPPKFKRKLGKFHLFWFFKQNGIIFIILWHMSSGWWWRYNVKTLQVPQSRLWTPMDTWTLLPTLFIYEHSAFQWPSVSPNPSLIVCIMDVEQTNVNLDQNNRGMFPSPCWINKIDARFVPKCGSIRLFQSV